MKVLIADDHPLVRSGIRGVLKDYDEDIEVFEAVDFPSVMKVVEDHPDLNMALLDLNMPGGRGISGLKELRERHPVLPVVVLSGSESLKDMKGALDCGASGYIPKSSSTDLMMSALNLVMSGGIYVPPQILTAQGSDQPYADGGSGGVLRVEGMTDRQTEVLALMREGKSNKEIARDLDIAESTVKAHVSVILKALNVSSRAKAILAADHLERG